MTHAHFVKGRHEKKGEYESFLVVFGKIRDESNDRTAQSEY